MTKHTILVLTLASLALPGCKKSQSKKPENQATAETPAAQSPPSEPPAPAPAEPAPSAAEPAPSAAEPAPSAPPASTAADPELMKAADAYVRKNAAKGVEYTLAVGAVDGNFARLTVTPKKPDDGAIVYMKRKGKTWTGVDMGTSIPCDDLEKEGFPPAVSKGCD